MPYLKFKGIDNINDIEKYKGKSLLVTRDNAVKLEENEYFIADMIGMKVLTEDEQQFGTLIDVLATGANDVYVIETVDKKEVLLPAIKQCILKIDMDESSNESAYYERIAETNELPCIDIISTDDFRWIKY